LKRLDAACSKNFGSLPQKRVFEVLHVHRPLRLLL
jgi:hypothetical protein